MAYFSQIIADEKNLRTVRTAQATDGATQIAYVGLALPGSSETDPVWMIKKVLTFADGSMSVLFAGGTSEYNQKWSDYAILTYS